MKTLLARAWLPLVATIAAMLLVGLWAALQRVGWALPDLRTGLATIHGPLMVGGVMGTLISLERAVALAGQRVRWPCGAPVCCGLGGILLVLTGDTPLAKGCILAGSAFLLLAMALIYRRHPASFTLIMLIGAGCWLAGNALWLVGQPVYQVVHTWIAFLVLTIAGERLELSRITRLTARAKTLFNAALALFLVGVAITVLNLDVGLRVAGAGEIVLGLWLLRYDIARKTVRKPGLPRFAAVCLLAGYAWLTVGGALGIWYGAVYAGFSYDALLHAVLLGFVFSMVFGHAPIIFPALSGHAITFHPAAYSYVLLLHLSLALRETGDWTGWLPGRMWGGLLNVAAVLLFIGLMVYFVLHHVPSRNTEAPLQQPFSTP
jgi:hypothetical protein